MLERERDVCIPAGLCADFCRMRHRIGECVALSLYCGQYGGAAFVLIYLVFLVIMGLPIMAMEFAVGRASRRSIAGSFHVLEPKGSKWHWYS